MLNTGLQLVCYVLLYVLKTGGHTAAARAVRWSLDGLRLASASDDRTVRLWDLPTGVSIGTRTGHTDYVRAMDASPASADCWIR
jgi:WD40 repeat protein